MCDFSDQKNYTQTNIDWHLENWDTSGYCIFNQSPPSLLSTRTTPLYLETCNVAALLSCTNRSPELTSTDLQLYNTSSTYNHRRIPFFHVPVIYISLLTTSNIFTFLFASNCLSISQLFGSRHNGYI